MALSKEQLSRIDAVLEDRYRELLLEIADESRQRNDPQNVELQQYGDEGDKSTSITNADLAQAEMNRHLGEAQEIEATRQRIAEGTYLGACDDCGIDIPFRRLLVMPTARRCAECQEYHDRTHRVAEMPSL